MCDMQDERSSIWRSILNWVRSCCPLWKAYGQLGAGFPVEEPADKTVIVYVTDQSERWRSKQWTLPSPIRAVVFMGEEYPGHEISDVHISHNSVHVYIRRRNAA